MRNPISSKVFVFLIGIIEMLIGIVTLFGVAVVQITGVYSIGPKPLNVYIFVVVTATASFVLGVGVIAKRGWAGRALIFFSGYIILTKLLRYFGILAFSGDIVTSIPAWGKDAISLVYHSFVIAVFLMAPRKNQ